MAAALGSAAFLLIRAARRQRAYPEAWLPLEPADFPLDGGLTAPATLEVLVPPVAASDMRSVAAPDGDGVDPLATAELEAKLEAEIEAGAELEAEPEQVADLAAIALAAGADAASSGGGHVRHRSQRHQPGPAPASAAEPGDAPGAD